MGAEDDERQIWRSLRQSFARLADTIATFRSSGAAFIEYESRTGVVLGASRALIDALGYDPIGQRTLELCHPDDIPATVSAWDAHHRGDPVTHGFLNRYRHRDGHYVWILWSPPVTPIAEIGAAFGVLVGGNPALAGSLAELERERAQ